MSTIMTKKMLITDIKEKPSSKKVAPVSPEKMKELLADPTKLKEYIYGSMLTVFADPTTSTRDRVQVGKFLVSLDSPAPDDAARDAIARMSNEELWDDLIKELGGPERLLEHINKKLSKK